MADTPANHVWYDDKGKEHPASTKPSMEGQPPALFREEGRPEPPTPEEWARLNDRHLKLDADGRGHLVDEGLGAGLTLREAIVAAEKAKAPKADAPTPEEG